MQGVKFSSQYRSFKKNLGYLFFFGCEIYDATPNDLDELGGNYDAHALNNYSESGLPDYLIPIFNFRDGYLAYMD